MTNLVFKYLSLITGNITEYFKLLEIQPDTHASVQSKFLGFSYIAKDDSQTHHCYLPQYSIVF